MNCKLCEQKTFDVANAVIAPWISKLSGLSIRRFSKLFYCVNCDFYFYGYEFSSSELDAMYSSYRENKYLSIRRSFEPWYSRKINDAYMSETDDLKSRVDFMTKILTDSGITAAENVVDFGGDEGQFFPRIAIKNRFLVDVSEKKLRDDVQKIPNLTNQHVHWDLVIVAHLLEHVNDPSSLLKEISENLSFDTFLYIEVPQDFPSVRLFHKSDFYKKFLEFSVKHKFIFILFDFLTGVKRQFKMRYPYFAIVKQSEHLNYFSLKSLMLLMNKLNFEVIKYEVDLDSNVSSIRMGRLGMLVKLIQRSNQE